MTGAAAESNLIVREANHDDFARINEIYNWTIVDNHVSFDTEPWDVVRRTEWWNNRGDDLHCLVGHVGGQVIGVTYSSYYRPKPAYRTTHETTIVLDTNYLGQGYGSVLLSSLLDRLTKTGVHMAVAIIALPNEGSVALHRKHGFREVGTLSDAGMKYDEYYDTMLMERPCS
jgi:phosphinothricin acetyltransferase